MGRKRKNFRKQVLRIAKSSSTFYTRVRRPAQRGRVIRHGNGLKISGAVHLFTACAALKSHGQSAVVCLCGQWSVESKFVKESVWCGSSLVWVLVLARFSSVGALVFHLFEKFRFGLSSKH
jgi:hypothetical protein